MHFYRSLSPIKAITFDLDDTLYDNSMIVENAEAALIKTLQQYDKLQDVTLDEFHREKKVVLAKYPEIYHDVIEWRVVTIKHLLKRKGLIDSIIEKIANESMDSFNEWRHKMSVPKVSHDLLTNLAEKYPLGVVTNGNVEIARIGLGDYFQFSLRGGEDGRSKPFPEIFSLAAEKLSVPAHQILHVGDSLYADVNGAIKSSMQACWINIFNQDIKHLSEARCLPHVEITQLSELYNLI